MITIVCGTNRKNSITKKISLQCKGLLSDMHIESHIIDLADLPDDFVVSALYENAGKNPQFNTFRDIIDRSEKFMFVVPEYNGSFPGVLKAFIDGMRYPGAFHNKKCALVGISSGSQGAGIALSHLTDIFNYMGMHVLAFKAKLSQIEGHMSGDRIFHEKYIEQLKKQARQLVEF